MKQENTGLKMKTKLKKSSDYKVENSFNSQDSERMNYKIINKLLIIVCSLKEVLSNKLSNLDYSYYILYDI